MKRFTLQINPVGASLAAPHQIIGYLVLVNWPVDLPGFETLEEGVEPRMYVRRGCKDWREAHIAARQAVQQVKDGAAHDELYHHLSPLALESFMVEVELKEGDFRIDVRCQRQSIRQP